MRETFRYSILICEGSLSYKTSLFSFQVDGGWDEWSVWGKCSKTCGSGIQLRSRTCSSPAPAGNGKPCVGDASEEKECNEGKCSSRKKFQI